MQQCFGEEFSFELEFEAQVSINWLPLASETN